MPSTPTATDIQTAPPAPPTTNKPTILALGLNDEETLESGFMYNGLAEALHANAQLDTVTSTAAAISYLTSPATARPSAILAIDSGTAEPEHAAVLPHLAAYVRERGGTLVFCCHFSSSARPDALGLLFQRAFGLPWAAGSYHRTTFALNGRAARANELLLLLLLPPRYSLKGVHLAGVADAHRLYVPAPDARVQSWVFAPERVDADETGVAWADVGAGMIGYVSDVNDEPESTRVVLSMCGL